MELALEQVVAGAVVGTADLATRCRELLDGPSTERRSECRVAFLSRGGARVPDDIVTLCQRIAEIITPSWTQHAQHGREFWLTVVAPTPDADPNAPLQSLDEDPLRLRGSIMFDLAGLCILASALAQAPRPRYEVVLHEDHGLVIRTPISVGSGTTIAGSEFQGHLEPISESEAELLYRVHGLDPYLAAVRLDDGMVIQSCESTLTKPGAFKIGSMASTTDVLTMLGDDAAPLRSCWTVVLQRPFHHNNFHERYAHDAHFMMTLKRDLTAWSGWWSFTQHALLTGLPIHHSVLTARGIPGVPPHVGRLTARGVHELLPHD